MRLSLVSAVALIIVSALVNFASAVEYGEPKEPVESGGKPWEPKESVAEEPGGPEEPGQPILGDEVVEPCPQWDKIAVFLLIVVILLQVVTLYFVIRFGRKKTPV